ncbi:MAG: SUMF1/EgtB/PvdO family nonheme iron enzyme [Caldilineaceae bacterium]
MQSAWQELQQELENPATTDQRRWQIGQQLAEMGDPRPGIGVKNGVPDMVWLPLAAGGEVTVIRTWHPESTGEEARVIHRQTFQVEPFYIAQYLVTHAQYQTFVAAEDGFDNVTWWQDIPTAYQRQPLSEQRTKLSNNPRDGLSWYQSVAFARWLNQRLTGLELPHPAGAGRFRVGDNAQIRLPAEWEWQWAAQNGAEARPYPWGEARPGYANTEESGLKQAVAVGMYPQGAAACGALDMAGNLMEWCANDKKNLEIVDVASPATKALRGGDWGYALDYASCTYCDDETPERMDFLNGCRLVVGSKLMEP